MPRLSTVKSSDGGAVGTADYMSPEQAIARDPLDGRSDLYSLGCVMYQLITGSVPFPEGSRVECLASRIKGRPVPIDERRPGMPPALVAVIDRLLATRREDRYATAALAAEALRVARARPPPSRRPSSRLQAGAGRTCPGRQAPGRSASTPRRSATCALSAVGSATPGARPGWWLRLLEPPVGMAPVGRTAGRIGRPGSHIHSGVVAALAIR